MTTILRARIAHTPRDPFLDSSALETYDDGAVAFDDGTILATGTYAEVSKAHPDAEVLDRRDCFLFPGLVDTHVHYPQIAVIGAMGLQLLDWLATRTLPEEVKMGDPAHARKTAQRFVRALAANGTTSALVFGSHFPDAQQALFEEADATRAADRQRPRGLQPQPAAGARGHAGSGLRRQPRAARALARRRPPALRGHAALQRVLRRGDARGLRAPCSTRTRPRCSPATSTRARARSSSCASCSRRRATTSAPTRTPGCSRECSVLAHNVHVSDDELDRLAAAKTARRPLPVEQRVPRPPGSSRWRSTSSTACASAMGTDVGAGTGLSMLKEGLRRLPRADGPRAGPHARPGAPALPGHRGGRRRARPGRPHRRPDARQGRRPASCCARRRAARSRPCSRTARTGRPRSARSSRSRARSRCSRCASAATSCSAARPIRSLSADSVSLMFKRKRQVARVQDLMREDTHAAAGGAATRPPGAAAGSRAPRGRGALPPRPPAALPPAGRQRQADEPDAVARARTRRRRGRRAAADTHAGPDRNGSRRLPAR